MKLNLQNIDTGSSILTNVEEAGDRGRPAGLSSYSTLPAQVCHKPNTVPAVQLRFQGKEEEEEEAVIITQGWWHIPVISGLRRKAGRYQVQG